MANNTNISVAELGRRLRLARESRGLTQAVAAKMAQIARTTLVAIEKGERPARPSELQLLAKSYKTSANQLLRQEAIHADLVPRFRKLLSSEHENAFDAAKILNRYVSAEIELENILGIGRERNYPQAKSILPGDVEAQASNDAMEMRQLLGLGNSPIGDLFTILEFDLGIRLFQVKLPNKISGMFAFDQNVGACIIVNASHRQSRRIMTVAHELGHFISTRHSPEVLEVDERFQSRDEKYADAFARSFLMPSRVVLHKFDELSARTGKITRRIVILLANYFNVSREAVVRRLEKLKAVPPGSWDWFDNNGGITDIQAKEVLGDQFLDNLANESGIDPISRKLGVMATQTWSQGLLSEGQLSNLLGLSRLEVRQLIDDVAFEDSPPDGLFERSS